MSLIGYPGEIKQPYGRVIIAGSRELLNIKEREVLQEFRLKLTSEQYSEFSKKYIEAVTKLKCLKVLNKIDFSLVRLILCGCARGADLAGKEFAESKNITVSNYPANWNLGLGAGYLRNAKMATEADCLVLIWDGKSRGSAHMLKVAKSAKLLVFNFVVGPNS